MARWTMSEVYTGVNGDITISKSDNVVGDTLTTKTLYDDRVGGVHFLSKGSINLYDANMKYVMPFSRGELFYVPDPSVGLLINRTVNFVTETDATFYCIISIQGTELLGTSTEIAAGDSVNLTDLNGKRMLLIEAATVNGVAYPAETILKFETIDSATIEAGAEDTLAIVFYEAPV